MVAIEGGVEVFCYQIEKLGEPLGASKLISVASKTAFELFKGKIADFIRTELESLGDIPHYSEVVSNLRYVLDTGETMQGEMSHRLPLYRRGKMVPSQLFEDCRRMCFRNCQGSHSAQTDRG